ncbi:ATP-dependent DNA ligase [Streptomyces sp. NBC_00467]|uniref:ATP-dependent DNA ligase n=1 Tax=Streptomyces sp. NBC_00467 TaxID=2975752 RepID=UPI002E184046
MTVDPPVVPMAAQALARLPAPGAMPGGMVFEPKYDGYRMLVFAHNGEVFLQSRNLRDLTGAFPGSAARC